MPQPKLKHFFTPQPQQLAFGAQQPPDMDEPQSLVGQPPTATFTVLVTATISQYVSSR